MAPVRRYLRISKYSVLECRIYLDNPALAQSWLLNPRDPILPRVIESIRPLVLPRLREEKEKERLKKKNSKKKQVKDVVVQDDFEVSMFLTETNTRHSLIFKNKFFSDKKPAKMESNASKLIGETDNATIDVDSIENVPVLREEDDEDDGTRLADIPIANATRKSKRRRKPAGQDEPEASDDDETPSVIEIDSDAEVPPSKRRGRVGDDNDESGDDKKKLAMAVSYEGFAIYGRVLCLVVKKRDNGKTTFRGSGSSSPTNSVAGSGADGARPEGRAMMED